MLFVLIFSVLSSVDHPLFEHALAEDEHGDDEHGDDEHGDDEHGDDEHGDDEHGDDEHGDDEHGDDEHGDDEHGDDEHGDDEHGDDEHGDDEHGDDEHGDDEHGDDEHGDDEHGDDEHGDDEHGDDEHGDDEHGDDEHGDDEHGDDEHGDDEHGDDEHTSSECTTNTLDALAHEFEHGRAYIQFHTDDGESPQNTGPGDLFTPGEIRGNIGPGDTDTIFIANANVTQMVLHGIDDTTPWDSVESSGTVVFNTGHHSDHIDYAIAADVDNVVGIHIHSGLPGENSHIHLVDIIPTDVDTQTNLSSSSPLTGEISVSDLCPGAHDDEHEGGDGDDGHGEVDDSDMNMSTDFAAILNAEQAIPESTSESTGTAIFSFNDDLTQLHYKILFSGLDLDGQQTIGHEHGDDEHTSSECTTNTLDALAHEFEHGRAYIQFHTDDGESPQNTGPGDLFTPGEIRGNIGPGDTDTIFIANANVTQMVLHGIDDTTPWDSVESSGTVVFNTGHHSDHIDYAIAADVDNVVGIHIHSGLPGENSHIHLVDIIPTDVDTQTNLSSSSPLTGEISVSDLCPGAHDDEHEGGDGDDGHGEVDDSEFIHDGGNGTSDGPDADDVSQIHIHNAVMGQNGPHALNIFGDPVEDDADMTFDAQSSTVMGIWDDEDENTDLSDSAQSKKLSEMLSEMCSEKLYLNVHTAGFPSGAIRGQILPSENSSICDPPSLVSGRIVSDNKIVLEFDKPVISDLSHFTNLEIPVRPTRSY